MMQDFDGVRDVAILAPLLPALEAEADRKIKAIENKIASAINDGKLTSDMAIMAWMEVKAIRDTSKSWRTRVLMGQSQGEKYAQTLEKA